METENKVGTDSLRLKEDLLRGFFENIRNAGEFLTSKDIEVAMESLRVASIEIREKEEQERRRKEIERELKERAEREARLAEARRIAEEKARKEHHEHVEQVTCMDLPLDWTNSFEADVRASEHVETASDGLMLSLEILGGVDIEFIAMVSDSDCRTVIENLRGSIYQNPLTWNECFYKGWETADDYLSGNLMYKYKVALDANNVYEGYFDANVKALVSAMGPMISSEDIYVTLGSPWVPSGIIDDFILHLAGLDPIDGQYSTEAMEFMLAEYKVKHDNVTGFWEIPQKKRFRQPQQHGKYEMINYRKWGTDRMDMLTLLENTLNMKTLTVCSFDHSVNKPLLDREETVKVIEKQEKMIEEFRNWVWKDEERKEMLQNSYFSKYGSIRRRHFDGQFLTFPGLAEGIHLFDYQKDSVARILMSPNTLLAHDVGSGKTFVMIAAGMELRRLGKSKKNLYVVPNGILNQWKSLFKAMYPEANLLIVDNSNFSGKKRRQTLEKISNEDFDGILMTYSCFDRLSLSDNFYEKQYQEMLEKLRNANSRLYDNRKIKNRMEKISKLLDEISARCTKNVCDIPFDELGINTLFVDEAHNYKNVGFDSNIDHVLGGGNRGSLKAKGMMDKVHCVQRMNNGGRVVFATGTPVTNSITDIYIMQRYLQDGELEFLNLQNFDAWAGMFAEKTTEFEIDVDTNSYHLATRFARFCNIPELTSILSSVADFHHVEKQENVPEFDGYTDSVWEGSEDFKDYLKDISNRADDIRQKRVGRMEDNLLKITSDGRKAALDMRLIDEAYGLDPDAKVFRCAENIYEEYERTRDIKGSQLVFCDSSTPKKGFNIYDELKEILTAMGIPSDMIAFVHDADDEKKRAKLFEKVNKGEIAVLIGSTFKMGLGVNVQERLTALHHLDVPWRPADMVQREGRIIRQGNTAEKVRIFRYITKGSFDAYSWQLLETKQRFISQILSGQAVQREGSDVDAVVLNYAEVKALAVGNPLIKKRVEVAAELDRYRILQSEYMERRYRNKVEWDSIPSKISGSEWKIEKLKKDIEFVESDSEEFKSPGQKERIDAKNRIAEAVRTKQGLFCDSEILTYRGFSIVVPAHMIPRAPNSVEPDNEEGEKVDWKKAVPYIQVRRNGSYTVEIHSEAGIMKRIDNLIENPSRKAGGTKKRSEAADRVSRNRRSGLERMLQEATDNLENLKTRRIVLETEMKSDHGFQDEVTRLRAELQRIDEELGINAA